PTAGRLQVAKDFGMSPEDVDILTRTIIGEAENQPFAGKQAVGNVLFNRAALSGRTPVEEAQRWSIRNGRVEYQFEPWGTRDGRERMLGPPENTRVYQEALRALVAAARNDVTGGATKFYSPSTQAALRRGPPDWDDGAGQTIGSHL